MTNAKGIAFTAINCGDYTGNICRNEDRCLVGFELNYVLAIGYSFPNLNKNLEYITRLNAFTKLG